MSRRGTSRGGTSRLNWIGEPEDWEEEPEALRLPQVFRLDDLPEDGSFPDGPGRGAHPAAEGSPSSGRSLPPKHSTKTAVQPVPPEKPAQARRGASQQPEAAARPAQAPFAAAAHRSAARTADAEAALPPDGARLSDVRPTRRGRCALFAVGEDGEEQFLFSVDEETCARLHLTPGACLSAQQLREARAQSDLRAAKDKALQYLSVRDHASGELYDKLCRRYDEPTSAAAVAEMQRLGLLDDAAFAVRRAAWMAGRGKSRREIDRALAGLGVGREERLAALEQLPEEEEATLHRLIERQYAAKLAAGRRDAVAAALLRRGFSGALVRRVLSQWAQPQEDFD